MPTAVGFTVTEPLPPSVPVQPPDAVQLVASTDDQVSVTESPMTMEALVQREGGRRRRNLRCERKRRIRLDKAVARIEVRRHRIHRQGACPQRLIDLRGRDRRICLQHQCGNAGHMRRCRRRAEKIRVIGIVFTARNAGRALARGQGESQERVVAAIGPDEIRFLSNDGSSEPVAGGVEQMGVPPSEEKYSSPAGVVPQAGVFR